MEATGPGGRTILSLTTRTSKGGGRDTGRGDLGAYAVEALIAAASPVVSDAGRHRGPPGPTRQCCHAAAAAPGPLPVRRRRRRGDRLPT